MGTSNNRRVAIVGTAQSWVQAPWTDPSIEIHSLNDAYRMKGFQRADAWFDFHPVNCFHYHDGKTPIYPHQIPHGYYCRPQGHLEWLTAQQIPVYLHPSYRTQIHDDKTPQLDPLREALIAAPHVRPFPRQDIEAHFGRYFTSSPAWMMALAILQGVREIHVYGIHLSTEFEYMRQRPNFEYLMGCLLGKGKKTVTVKNECRYYESPDGLLVLPESSPVLQETFQYAFDPKPDSALEPVKWELHKIGIKKQRAMSALMQSNWWQVLVPYQHKDDSGEKWMYRRRKTIRDEMIYLDALASDYQDQLARHQPLEA